VYKLHDRTTIYRKKGSKFSRTCTHTWAALPAPFYFGMKTVSCTVLFENRPSATTTTRNKRFFAHVGQNYFFRSLLWRSTRFHIRWSGLVAFSSVAAAAFTRVGPLGHHICLLWFLPIIPVWYSCWFSIIFLKNFVTNFLSYWTILEWFWLIFNQ
jgi:hypothetical protein